jgi:methyltransferase (TIGR00027 family)
MFKSLKRITYPVSNLAAAKQWYTGVLDLQPILDTPFLIIFKIGDCTLSLSKANSPISPADAQTETYWEVDDIDSSFQKLISLGAKEHTPITDRLNIRIAKVIDPFGNIFGITGLPLDVTKRSVKNKPSESALLLTFCRALAANDEREEIKGPDYLAEYFLTEESKKPLKDSTSRKWAIQKLITSPKYGYSISRTAYIDHIFKKHLSENIPQIVILGAGYDTRAHRYHGLLGSTKIYEIDIQTTQKRKIDILKTKGLEISKKVTYLSVNFETDNVEEALSKASFNSGTRTLYIWEGVTYYLTRDTIKRILNLIGTHSSNASIVCFDYLADKIDSMNAAEPYQFVVDKEELKTLLSEHNFRIIEHIDSKEMIKRYLTLKDGSFAEECLTHFCFVTAMNNIR